MNPAIASLRQRMSQGGDWRTVRDEIAHLHPLAQTEVEFVELLECHALLRTLIPEVFDAETAAKLAPIAEGEYKLFLNVEAMEGGEHISPQMLAYVTAREVAAGRLAEDDDFRRLAEAGALLGDHMPPPNSRIVDYSCLAAAIAAIVLWLLGFRPVGVSPLWLVPAAVLVGFFINDLAKRKWKRGLADERAVRGYSAGG